MMNAKFVRADINADEFGRYGLKVTKPCGEVKSYDSIFSDIAEAEELCKRINSLSVSECHIDDIIEDSIG